MGYTLDQLLDETGVNSLGATRLEKKAAEKPNFGKFAERLRKAAAEKPEERASAADQALTEKTAAVAIIGRTLAEIREITGGELDLTKTASDASSPALPIEAFIKQALDAGHAPDKIAEWLDKNAGLFDKLKGGVREFRAGRAAVKAERLAQKAEAAGGKAFRRWEDHVRHADSLGDAERVALVSRMRINLGDERAAKLIAGSKSLRDLPNARDLKKVTQDAAQAAGGGAKPSGISLNVGNAQMGISSEQLNKLKKPAALLGAGYLGHKALSGRNSGEGEKKKSGVVVVNS